MRSQVKGMALEPAPLQAKVKGMARKAAPPKVLTRAGLGSAPLALACQPCAKPNRGKAPPPFSKGEPEGAGGKNPRLSLCASRSVRPSGSPFVDDKAVPTGFAIP
jgi:hypothetical protein